MILFPITSAFVKRPSVSLIARQAIYMIDGDIATPARRRHS